MKDLVWQILTEYFKNLREPKPEELDVKDDILKKEKGCCFVTLYLNGEVRWSAGNIKEIHENLLQELIANTIAALTGDKRFSPLTLNEAEKIQFRIDKITHREMLSIWKIGEIDPTKSWVIAIKRDYEALATILPNISPKLMTWEDFIPVLENKLKDKKLNDKKIILYRIETLVETNY